MVPNDAKRTAKKRVVLAEGETTGHAHRINSTGAELFDLNGRMFLKVVEPAMLTHEEHKHIEIDPGIYEVGRVREYDWLQKMERKVID